MEETTLIERARNKDPDAFVALMERHMQSMYKAGKAILMNDTDVADAVQDTILTCWEKLTDLRNAKYFKTWLMRILINHCYAQIRKNQNVTYVDELPDMMQTEAQDNICWKEALSGIEEKYRIVIVLYYSEGFRTKEIAEILHIPDSTVRTRLARGREQLAKYYKE